MEAKDYLKKIGITDRVLNREDLPEYWKSISQLMEEYAALCQPPVVGRSEQLACVHPYGEVYQSDTECYCERCGKDLTKAS